MNLIAAQKMAIDKMREHGLLEAGWTFEFNNRKRASGLCNFRKQKIFLSEPRTELNDEAFVLNTVLHEIAHALVGSKNGHNIIWQMKAKAIGCNGQRAYRNDDETKTPAGKYRATCPNCGNTVIYYKKTKKRRACGFCCAKYNQGNFTEKFLFEITQLY
jgi:predicted SprT family Zn-dependent metalloprotease